MTTYPQYPAPVVGNVQPDGFNAKISVDRLIEVVHEFQALDLYPVPKKAGDKIAWWPYWMKRDGHVPLEVNDENLRRDLPKPQVDGIILSVGKSLNGRLVVLDLDPAGDHVKAEAVYHEIQCLSPTRFVIVTPANGLHLYYRLPDDVPQLKPTTGVHWDVLDIRAKTSLIGLPGSFQQYTDKAEKKGVQYGHIGYYRRLHNDPEADYTAIPTLSKELYDLLYSAQNPVRATAPEEIGAHNYEHTPEAIARIEEHLKRPVQEREKLVIECLAYVLTGWANKTYDQWLQMWMSAHHGSGGSVAVRDFIASHPDVWAGRKQADVDQFVNVWNSHVSLPDGYTVASLMYLARQAGWLQTTGMELPTSLVQEIDVQYIQEWTKAQDALPNRVLVMSQTGSGKTYNISHLYERLGSPKTVIFVPTTKLAIELATTLRTQHKLPVTLYIDVATGRILPAEKLQAAKVLVTTLQTFGSKVHKHSPMGHYGLVYFEESDQLFQQFGRGGGGAYTSHVSEHEARRGFAVIRDAFEHSGNVWCVDATMTQVTHYVADQMRGEHKLTVIRNKRVMDKAPVRMLSEKGEAYQVVLASLLANKKVVVACDTAQVAAEVVDTMGVLGVLKDKKHLLITAHTERSQDVHAFMQDINTEAQKYDLLVYNSVMASGVSITSVKPDVLVQICTFLTPRVNLQLLNRYRSQRKVYCFYQQTEALYLDTDLTVMTEAYRRAGLEAALVNMPLAERLPDATVRARVSAMSTGDETLQRRSARDFYTALLERDGRLVTQAATVPQSSVVGHSIKVVRALKKEQREALKSTWPDTRPIDRENPADPDMTDIEVAQGEIHAWISRTLRGNIPANTDPALIYDMVHDFRRYNTVLTAFVKQGEALREAETYLADEARAITTLANRVTHIKLVTLLGLLYTDVNDVLTSDRLEQRAQTFVKELRTNKDAYNAVINPQRQKFDEVYNRSETDEERAVDFAKILLATMGLKQRSVRGQMVGGERGREHVIENADSAITFLKWQYPDDPPAIVFSDEPIRSIIDARGGHIRMFQAMTKQQQAQVMRLLNDEKTTDFPTAVESVLMGDQF